jgi:hypothetical protein
MQQRIHAWRDHVDKNLCASVLSDRDAAYDHQQGCPHSDRRESFERYRRAFASRWQVVMVADSRSLLTYVWLCDAISSKPAR